MYYTESHIIISPILKLWGIDYVFNLNCVSVSATHAKACATGNCTNVHIIFIFDTAIDDLDWNNPMAPILSKYDE